jgi:DNA-damage-inducible protein J
MCYMAERRMTMGKTETIRARVEPRLKRDAEAVLKKIGLTSSEAITLFLTQVKLTKGLPFPLRVPNAETRRAIREARARKDLETFETVSDWAKTVRDL